MNFPRKPLFWSVALGHAINDTFMSLGAVLLTFMSSNAILPISTQQFGLAETFRALVGSFSQPFFGWMAEKTGGRWLGAGGVAWTVGFMLLGIGIGATTGNFLLMVIPYSLAALGSGAFHPVGSLHAAESDKTRANTNISWFFLWGQLGLAFGPLITGFLLQQFNSVVPIFFVGLLAVPVVIFMVIKIPSKEAYRLASPEKFERKNTVDFAALPWKSLGLLLLVVTLRGVAQPGSGPFISKLFEFKGWEPASYGFITSMYWLASGLSGVWFASLENRFERRKIVAVSLLLAAPAFVFLPASDGVMAVILALLSGALSGGSHSVIVTAAQELMPGNKAFAAGAILGIIFGMGAIGTFLIGTIAEATSLPIAFYFIGAVTVVAAASAFLLPRSKGAVELPVIEPLLEIGS
jgi:MFS transporter, FSR family, fosmidomycin resistance protein